MKCTNCGKPAKLARGNYHLEELEMPVKLIGIELVKCAHCAILIRS